MTKHIDRNEFKTTVVTDVSPDRAGIGQAVETTGPAVSTLATQRYDAVNSTDNPYTELGAREAEFERPPAKRNRAHGGR